MNVCGTLRLVDPFQWELKKKFSFSRESIIKQICTKNKKERMESHEKEWNL